MLRIAWCRANGGNEIVSNIMIKPIKNIPIASEEVRKKPRKQRKSKKVSEFLQQCDIRHIAKQLGTLSFVLFGIYAIGSLIIGSYQYAKDKGAGYIPVVEASIDDIKFVPEDRGGLEIKNLDVNVYDVAVSRADTKNVKQELRELKQETTEPLSPEEAIKLELDAQLESQEILAELANENKGIKLDAANIQEEKVESGELGTVLQERNKQKAELEEAREVIIKEVTNPLTSETTKIVATTTQTTQTTKSTEVKNIGDIAEPKKEIEEKIVKLETQEKNVDIDEYSEKKVNSHPIYRVQFASLRTKRSAEQYWNKLLINHSDLFTEQPYIIEKIAVGTRGTFYRLKVGEFLNGDIAKNFCNKYTTEAKKSPDACLVVKSY